MMNLIFRWCMTTRCFGLFSKFVFKIEIFDRIIKKTDITYLLCITLVGY